MTTYTISDDLLPIIKKTDLTSFIRYYQKRTDNMAVSVRDHRFIRDLISIKRLIYAFLHNFFTVTQRIDSFLNISHPIKNRFRNTIEIPNITFIHDENLIINFKIYPMNKILRIHVFNIVNLTLHFQLPLTFNLIRNLYRLSGSGWDA